jgi:AcrR family transcriptional regulator
MNAGGPEGIDPAGETTREARRKHTEARILEAARDVLLERSSVDALPLREVARRAGFAPGALYRYFADRGELIRAMYVGALQVLGSYLADATGGSAAERLISQARLYLKFGHDRPQDLILLFESAVPKTPWGRYATVAWPFTTIIETVQSGMDTGQLQPLPGLDAAGTAYAFWALIHGFAALQAGHLAAVAGPFGKMHEAAINDFVARLRATERSSS